MKKFLFMLCALMAFVPALADELPLMPEPVIVIEEEETRVQIYAVGEGNIHLFINGEAVDMPYVCYRSYEEIFLTIVATAESVGWETNYAQQEYVVIPIPIPFLEITSAPTFSSRSTEYGYAVTINQTEPSTIYYRVAFMDEMSGGWDYIIDWTVYDGEELIYSTQGHYRIEAYAVAYGKDDSELACYEFIVYPYPLYDFMEDGIFYKITGEGKVSVCAETTDYNSYSGYVTIPATVTHDGVTYMVSAIYNNAFLVCKGLTGVTIGPYVTSIGDRAFDCCRNLTSVTLGDYVINVGEYAFYGCSSLTSVTLGSGLSRIGNYAFGACSALTTVNCKAATPPSMASSNCFGGCNGATLYVYPAVLDRYQSSTNWSRFSSIVGEDSVAPVTGDTNGDGRISISDVSTLINMLLSGQ